MCAYTYGNDRTLLQQVLLRWIDGLPVREATIVVVVVQYEAVLQTASGKVAGVISGSFWCVYESWFVAVPRW